MIMSPRWLRAAGMVMILVSLGVAGDTPGISSNSDRAAAPPSCGDRPAQDPAGLEMRRPSERGKVPVVLIHGLWGRPQLWDRMVESLEADPAVRKPYQFWTFRYASGDLIPFSAHLLRRSLRREGVASELLVRGLHICLDHPAVIREVRRILMEHAGIATASRADHRAPCRLTPRH